MSPPAHLMLRGPPQRVASLALAWHTARRQRHIHAAECLRTAQSWQPVKANAMAEPPCTRPGARPAEPRPTTAAAWLGPAGGVWAKGWFQEGELAWQEGWWRRCIIDERDLPLAFVGGAWLPSAPPGRGNHAKTSNATLLTGVTLLHHQPKSANPFYKRKCHRFV